MTLKDFFSFRANRYFWLNLLAMAVVLGGMMFGVMRWLDVYTRHGQAVAVPSVKGLSVRQAEDKFRSCGLACQVADSAYHKELAPGSIIDVHPDEGQKVKEGRIIYLTINTRNIPPKAVPDVADNSSLRQAEARLLAAGFKLAAIDTVRGEKDWVYGVKYNGRLLQYDEQVPTGAALVLVVGNGDGEGYASPDDTTETVAPTEPKQAPAKAVKEEDESNSWF